MRAYENIPRQSMRKRGFDRNRLPPAADHYQPIFRDLQFNANGWAQRPVSSPIHEKGPVSASTPPGQNLEKELADAWDIAHVLKERSYAGAH
jgi:hypothetical protein